MYYLVASTFGRKAYNFWAILAAECLAVVLWIINFSLVGALADWWTVQCTYDPYYGYYVCFYDKRDLALEKRNTTTISTYYSILVATAIAGALELWVTLDTVSPLIQKQFWNGKTWLTQTQFSVLFLATLITFSIRLHRHRRSSMQASAANPPAYSLAYPLVENAYEPSVKADARPPPPPYT